MDSDESDIFCCEEIKGSLFQDSGLTFIAREDIIYQMVPFSLEQDPEEHFTGGGCLVHPGSS